MSNKPYIYHDSNLSYMPTKIVWSSRLHPLLKNRICLQWIGMPNVTLSTASGQFQNVVSNN